MLTPRLDDGKGKTCAHLTRFWTYPLNGILPSGGCVVRTLPLGKKLKERFKSKVSISITIYENTWFYLFHLSYPSFACLVLFINFIICAALSPAFLACLLVFLNFNFIVFVASHALWSVCHRLSSWYFYRFRWL